jgi:hypothetical protein
MPVKPPAPKHTCEDLGNELIISIPSLKIWFLIIFMGFWLILWLVVVGVSLIGTFLFNRIGPDVPSTPVLILLIFIWVLIAGFVIHTIAWQVSGREVVKVTTQSLAIRAVALGRGSQKEYSASYIKDLRVSSSNMDFFHPMMMWYGYSYPYPWPGHHHNNMGSIAFDYGARTFRFGSGVDEAEAKQILAEIQQKYPQYKN